MWIFGELRTDKRKTSEPMRIALDFNPVLRNRFSGFWTFGVELLSALVESPEVRGVTLLFSRDRRRAAGEIPCWGHPKIRHVSTRMRLRQWERWWRICPYPRLQRLCGEFDVYHSFHHLMPPTGNRPRVLVVHDLRRYRLKGLYPDSKVGPFERSVGAADRIIAISRSTRKDLVDLLGVDPAIVEVVPLGTPTGFSPRPLEQNRQMLRVLSRRFSRQLGGYAVAVGSRDRRKNLPTTVRAFARAAGEVSDDFCLLIVGDVPQDGQLQTAISRSGISEKVLLTGAVDEGEYQAILPAARMMLFLSLYEGFGLPLLEAMASGVPVIGSDCSSIPEVLGDAGLLVNPTDEDGIARHIVALARDNELSRWCSAKGLERAGQFTWQRTGEGMLACYARAMGKIT